MNKCFYHVQSFIKIFHPKKVTYGTKNQIFNKKKFPRFPKTKLHFSFRFRFYGFCNGNKIENKKHSAVSHITGFVIRHQRNGGCRVGYIAHCDPQGTLPPWLVNKVTHSLGPRMVKDLRKAALGYKKWKNVQTHHRKPWRFPEEIITSRISVLDVRRNSKISVL